MKKLMLAAAMVCAAVMSYGATANWQASASAIYDGTGKTDAGNKLDGLTAYFFDAGLMTQENLYKAIAGGTAISAVTTGKAGTGSVVSGGITAANAKFGYGEQGGTKYSYYFAIVDGDQVYMSNILTDLASNGTDQAKSIAFGNQNMSTKGTFSSVAPTGSGFAGAGHWSAVPEPTSGLLMLLGLAGLALRRRRA